ncbi:MAG: hypothetical protein A7316_00055 [Candidatus Altiarchaeales archaeon WOR_SM1_86-2]|nr:MAG: hypothetical protein A7316_00055 [Candidatus Altiarchaeales archaeon WOR_SM1_86-2]ODS40864.1 MAG: hypothetical protein A7315_07410 [Candidatus Altiarchaeales archaeon WOR_SM1_79]
MSKYETYENYCRIAHNYFKGFVKDFKPSRKLKEAIKFTGMKVKPAEVYALAVASVFALLLLTLILFFVFILIGIINFAGILICIIFLLLPIVMYFYMKDYPILMEGKEKAHSSGDIPGVVSYLVMALRINPNMERAIKFAANHSTGTFEKVLKKMMYNIRTGKYSAERGLAVLGDEWGEVSPEFKRSMRLVVASTSDKTEGRRQETLNKAAEVLLTGLSERTGDSARKLHTPVMMVFTFGVILPLIFIALIPLASFMGFGVGAPLIALLYIIVLPAILYILINFIIGYRPVTIPPPRIPLSEYPEFKLAPFVILFGFLITLPGFLYLSGVKIVDLGALSMTPILLGISAALSGYFIGTSYRIKRMRDDIYAMEGEFGETMYQLGVILSEGRSLEDAMSRIKEMSRDAKSAEIFAIAANNVRLFNMDLKSAFFDSKAGSARKVFSDTIKSAVETIVAISSRGSASIASLAYRLSDHIKNMRAVDAEIKRTLGSVVSSMQIIAGVVGPLVGGMISGMSNVLAGSMGKVIAEGAGMFGFGTTAAAEPISPGIITIIVGIYVIETAIILISFSDDLIYGGDAVMKKYHLGLYIPAATLMFITSAWAAGVLIGGLGG